MQENRECNLCVITILCTSQYWVGVISPQGWWVKAGLQFHEAGKTDSAAHTSQSLLLLFLILALVSLCLLCISCTTVIGYPVPIVEGSEKIGIPHILSWQLGLSSVMTVRIKALAMGITSASSFNSMLQFLYCACIVISVHCCITVLI